MGAWMVKCVDRGQRGDPSLPLLATPLQLEQALDTGVPAQLGGPGACVLSTLQDPSGSLSTSKGRAILCVLGALVGKRGAPGLGLGGRGHREAP